MQNNFIRYIVFALNHRGGSGWGLLASDFWPYFSLNDFWPKILVTTDFKILVTTDFCVVDFTD